MENRSHALTVSNLTHAEVLDIRRLVEETHLNAETTYSGSLIGAKIHKKMTLRRVIGRVTAYSFETGKFKVVYGDRDQMKTERDALRTERTKVREEKKRLSAAIGERGASSQLLAECKKLSLQEREILGSIRYLNAKMAKCPENEFLTLEEVNSFLIEEPCTLVERINKVDASGCRSRTFAAMLKEMVEAKEEIRACLPGIFNKRTDNSWEEGDFTEITPSLWANLGSLEEDKWPRARMILGDVAAL
jgi:hypothetical protein